MKKQNEKLDFKSLIMIICLVILLSSRFIQENDRLGTYLILIASLPILIITIMDVWKEYHTNPINIIGIVRAILLLIIMITLVFYLGSGQLIFAILMISAVVVEAMIDIFDLRNGEFSKAIPSILILIYLGIVMLNHITLKFN